MIHDRNLSFDLRRLVKSDSRDLSITSHDPSYSIRARPCRLHEDERVYYKMMFVPKCSGTMCERERNEKSAAIIIGGMRCSRERHVYVRDGCSRPSTTEDTVSPGLDTDIGVNFQHWTVATRLLAISCTRGAG